MNKCVIYIHGLGGNIIEAEHYKSLFCDCEVIGFDYKANDAMSAINEFKTYFNNVCSKYEEVKIIANSIGAYYALVSLSGFNIKSLFLISPVVDMVKLIENMMADSNISEKELENKKEIKLDNGQVLSYDYLLFARNNETIWHGDCYILYGENDKLTDIDTIKCFSSKVNGKLNIMKNGNHYLYTKEDLDYIDVWILENENK